MKTAKNPELPVTVMLQMRNCLASEKAKHIGKFIQPILI